MPPSKKSRRARSAPSKARKSANNRQRVRLSGPGELIAAIPAMLGFYPERSIVLMCIDKSLPGQRLTMGPVLRADIDVAAAPASLRSGISRLAQVLPNLSASSALAVFVDDRCEDPAMGPKFDLVADLVEAELAECGLAMDIAIAVPTIANGARWTALQEFAGWGSVNDPRANPLTAAQVFDGQAIVNSRAELEALLAPDSVEACEAVAACIEALPTPDVRGPGTQLRFVLTAIDQLAAGQHVEASAAAAVIAAVQSYQVRDALFATAHAQCAEAAKQMWTYCCRVAPSALVPHVAVLLGYANYAHGNGAMAAIALGRAQAADPDHHMSDLLLTALDNGLHPNELACIAHGGYEMAQAMGVEILGPKYPPRCECLGVRHRRRPAS